MEKIDIEKDLKALEMHEPSSGFTSRVTMKAVQQLESKIEMNPWIKWIPRFCLAGFAAVFLVLMFLIIKYFNVKMIDPNSILAFQAIGLGACSYLIYKLMDRTLKLLIVR